MKVQNMVSSSGNKVANQFVIEGVSACQSFDGVNMRSGRRFQSYDSMIAHVSFDGKVYLDLKLWNYSKTTSKYRNIFLGETTKETQAKINSGEYVLVDLN